MQWWERSDHPETGDFKSSNSKGLVAILHSKLTVLLLKKHYTQPVGLHAGAVTVTQDMADSMQFISF
jgi:hypothetical protein